MHKTTAASSSAMHTIVAHFTDARVLLASDLQIGSIVRNFPGLVRSTCQVITPIWPRLKRPSEKHLMDQALRTKQSSFIRH